MKLTEAPYSFHNTTPGKETANHTALHESPGDGPDPLLPIPLLLTCPRCTEQAAFCFERVNTESQMRTNIPRPEGQKVFHGGLINKLQFNKLVYVTD